MMRKRIYEAEKMRKEVKEERKDRKSKNICKTKDPPN